MSLPETIPVRFTEEEAGYLSVRPVVRQTFRLAELADMVVSVTGKDPARVAQILRAGAVLYNGYRYWWDGFSAAPGELAALLAPFPDADPARPFRWEEATAVLLESGGGPARTVLEVTRAEASRRRLFRRRSAWDCLRDALRDSPPAYEQYSYARRADLYRRSLAHDAALRLRAELLAVAPRALRVRLGAALPSALLFACPRAAPRA
ncbi:MAG: hypothetical protein LAN84_13080 [Acidobacteriia bacterium]|nr:hypothetical protein [Terriglobia bacterium]